MQVQRRENVLAVLIPLGARRGEPFLRPEGEPFLRPEGAAKELSNRLLHPSHTPKFPFYAIFEGNGYSWSRFLLRRAMGLQTPYSGIYI